MRQPFDTVEGRKLTWINLMARQPFLVTLVLGVLGALAGSVSAQIGVHEQESPFGIQQPPVYLKSRTSTRGKELEDKRDLETDVLVDATIDRVGRSFHNEDADELEACLVTGKRKIYLSLEIDDSQRGHYGPGQVRHIFGRLFREVETRAFIYDSTDVGRHTGSTTFRADWTFVVLDTDELVTERLQFKLEKGKSAWRIYEIRAASR